MNILHNLFNGSKEIEEKKRKTSVIVHDQKEKFTKQMWKIQLQAHKAKKKTEASKKEVDRLVQLVDDVSAQVARATGGLKDE